MSTTSNSLISNIVPYGNIKNKLTNDDDTDLFNYHQTIKTYKDAIYNLTLNIKLNLTENQEYIDQIMEYSKSIPRVQLVELKINANVPELTPIRSEKSDTKEIKNMIQKINKKVKTHFCDHSKLENLYLNYQADLLKLRKNKDYQIVDKFFERLAEYVYKVEKKDKLNKKFKNYNFHVSLKEVDDIVQHTLNFSAEVLKFKSKYENLKCAKCEKLIKEYDYYLETIEELRYEEQERINEQIREIKEQNDENYYIKFMNEHFSNIKRIKLMDIVKVYKLINKRMITQDEMRAELEATGLYKITNVHRIYYCNKI